MKGEDANHGTFKSLDNRQQLVNSIIPPRSSSGVAGSALIGKDTQMKCARWELFPHGADMGIRGVGSSKEIAFEQAGVALTAVITDPARVHAQESVGLSCAAPDDELLLVEWLNALIYEMATRKMLFARFQVRLDDRRLTATAWGEPVDIARHEPAVEIKGATCTALKVERAGEEWRAQCVVDV